MKKVLLIATTRLTMDGLTEILLRVARIAAREYLVGFALGEGCSADIQPQLEAIGSVYQLPSRKKKLPCYMAALAALVQKKGYEVVHIHGNSATMAFDLLAVWAGGATVRITHCHNCAHQPALKQATLGRLLNRLVTDPVACSRATGEMLYTRPFRVLVNGIDCERFSFSPSVREQMRAKLGLQDCFVVGHIGRFSQQKITPGFSASSKQSCSKSHRQGFCFAAKERISNNLSRKPRRLALRRWCCFAVM